MQYILSEEEEGEEHFCDHCPVQVICPNEYKPWSQ
jgi:hypothetical protein